MGPQELRNLIAHRIKLGKGNNLSAAGHDYRGLIRIFPRKIPWMESVHRFFGVRHFSLPKSRS
jgi:hypothetical protein